MKGAFDISYFNLGLGYLLLLIPIAILILYKTGLAKATIIAIVRMTIQLLLVGIYLKYVFLWDKWWINLLWGLLMIIIATFTIGGRAKMKHPVFLIPMFTAFLTAMLVVDFYFLKIVLQLKNPLTARYFIPITGMILGNCLRSNVIALNVFYSGIHKNKNLYHFLIGNGATQNEATLPFMKEALITAFNPVIANTAVMGLISLPGMMTGQILGGSNPDVAIKYQIMLMITIFVASTLTVFLTIKIVNLIVFDKFSRLKSNYFNF